MEFKLKAKSCYVATENWRERSVDERGSWLELEELLSSSRIHRRADANRSRFLLQSISLGLISSSLSLDRPAQQHNHHHRHKAAPINGTSAAGHSWIAQPDADAEVDKRAKNSGWSTWSGWSTCSRSCDGGVAQQLRRCLAQHGCRGEPVRHKICNMQVNI